MVAVEVSFEKGLPVILATLIIMAAAAAETAVGGAPNVSGSGWISGDTLTTLISILAGAGGVVGGKMWGERSAKKVKADIPQPLAVELKEKFVTRVEFDKHVEDNSHDHENIFNRLTSNDKSMGEIKGMLSGIREDLSFIKGKFFKR